MPSLQPAEFRALDPDLPSIAALAAAEVDDLIHHRQSAVNNLKKLSALLAKSFERGEGQVGSKYFLDPNSVNVVVSTLRDAHAGGLSSYDELAETSLRLAGQMRAATNIVEEPLLANLKRFCLALSKHSLASMAGNHDASTASEYKR
jgi:hypothetical protein